MFFKSSNHIKPTQQANCFMCTIIKHKSIYFILFIHIYIKEPQRSTSLLSFRLHNLAILMIDSLLQSGLHNTKQLFAQFNTRHQQT